MKFSVIRAALADFEQAIQPLISLERCEWLERVDARWLDKHDTVFKNRFGIYFYAQHDGDILYIGKAQDSTLRDRVWSHLSTPCLERHQSIDRVGLRLYPNQQWNVEDKEFSNAATLVEAGDMTIHALDLCPNHVAGLFESFVLTFCQLNERLPLLNRKLG